jgi:UDP-glucuronate 4-epimerase
MKRVLVTGAAGFIGYHVSLFLKTKGDFAIGLDNFNTYYDVRLKRARAQRLQQAGIEIQECDILDRDQIQLLLLRYGITHVIHLAAQAGVRHSILEPEPYISSNVQGFLSILEACRRFPSLKLIYASSSSVYGLNQKTPFSVDDPTDLPANLYGATKKANELMAHSYHHLYGLSVTALRFFSVYGPWGRPDMAYYQFSEKISRGEPIRVHNGGMMRRDFTYIDDIVRGTAAALDLGAAHEIFNLGNKKPVPLLHLIELLEQFLGKKAILEMLPMQAGEVVETYADIEKSERLLNYHPTVSIEEGLARFVDWFKDYSLRSALKTDPSSSIKSLAINP